jgi:hypothetical protein
MPVGPEAVSYCPRLSHPSHVSNKFGTAQLLPRPGEYGWDREIDVLGWQNSAVWSQDALLCSGSTGGE